jgi:hypothetical protein
MPDSVHMLDKEIGKKESCKEHTALGGRQFGKVVWREQSWILQSFVHQAFNKGKERGDC